MVFYLVLRALDTIEDDMEFFPSHAAKIQELEKFCSRALSDPDWECRGVGEGDERKLLEEFGHVRVCFQALDEESRRVILDITVRMARGMGEYIGKDLGQGTENVKEYNRYCHFVAGLVGEGLSRLFAVSGLEEKVRGLCVCVCVCARERESVCEKERVCARKREREREREGAS